MIKLKNTQVKNNSFLIVYNTLSNFLIKKEPFPYLLLVTCLTQIRVLCRKLNDTLLSLNFLTHELMIYE